MKNKLLLLSILTFYTLQISAQTKVIAHRGFSAIAPENTRIAFQKAIESGADYFELDVHQSSDGHVFVIHDASVNRTSSNQAKGKVAQMTCKELKKVKVGYTEKFGDAYKDEKLPTLKEVLKLAKGKIKVCIEIKVYDVEEEVLKIVKDLDMEQEVIIFSFYYPVLTKIRQLDTNISILYLKDKVNTSTIDYAMLINANAIGAGYGTTITKELLKFAHKNDIEIWKWTVNDENQMQELFDMGLDGLITNHPDKAIKIVNP